MSDLTVEMHTLKCDYPGCNEQAQDDKYSACADYNQACEYFADTWEPGWLHTPDRKDFCPKHNFYDDEADEYVPVEEVKQ